MQQVTDALNSVKTMLGAEEPKPKTFWEELSSKFQLSWFARIGLFIVFMLIGLFFCGLSTLFLLSPTSFAKFYTFGSIFIIASTFFLVGPARQVSSIFSDKSRAISAGIYISTIILTLYSALYLHWISLTTLAVMVQFAAALWYGASYIPYAQNCLVSTARTILPI
ncbi:ethanolamine kinase A [Pelomyxa schiedti]|nr:ethanolamine kinase A [Pelomyxa schiedti]